mmetsp:Transcript_19424/g.42091  ORF Transcript_19424/g.42091 Transcript_19424/m.42091 type:complete len:87 (-) Transcript_19424:251-511(-)
MGARCAKATNPLHTGVQLMARQRIMLRQQAAHLIVVPICLKAPEQPVPVLTVHGPMLQQQRHNLHMVSSSSQGNRRVVRCTMLQQH